MRNLTLLLALLAGWTGGIARGQEDHSAHRSMMTQTKRYSHIAAEYRAPAVTLVNQEGEPVSLQSIVNGPKPVVLNFIFTTCTTICPVMSATFSKMRKELGPAVDSLRMVSISIDPEYDTPAALKRYAAKFDAAADWQFLTGKFDDIISVERAFDAFTGDKANHRPLTFFKRPGAAEWVRIEGLASGSDLANEYKMLAGHSH